MYYKLVPTKGIGLIGIGDSQKALKQFQLAVDAYTSAIKLYESQQAKSGVNHHDSVKGKKLSAHHSLTAYNKQDL